MNRQQRRHPSSIEFRAVTLDSLETRIEADDPAGRFGGYANLHGVTDSYGTRFRRGAWAAGTPDLDRPTALLWMHDPTNPIGVFQAREDETGLWIEGRFDDTDEGQRARARAISGSAPELSVGFVRLANDDDDSREIVSSRLVETSLITARMASQPGAQLTSVRDALSDYVDDAEDEADVIDLEQRRRRLKGLGLRLRLGGIQTQR
jgi:HK97 family phage prohead protease